MKNKEFLDFISTSNEVPAGLKKSVQKDLGLSLRWKSILMRFLFLQFIGAIFSLAICPQFGVGLMEGHGLFHYFRSFGELACASFCGALFLSSGLLLAVVGMKGEELWWIWKRYKVSLVLLPALFWGVLMIANKSLHLPAESIWYSFTWIVVAGLVQGLWMQVRSGIYFKSALQN